MFCEWRGTKDDGCKFKKTGVKLGSTMRFVKNNEPFCALKSTQE